MRGEGQAEGAGEEVQGKYNAEPMTQVHVSDGKVDVKSLRR